MNNNLYALDFPPAVEIEPAIEYFESLKREDLLEWRVNLFE
jgi:hypothetical protein